MSKRHKRRETGNPKEQNKEIRRREQIGKKPKTKERTSPGELHKVQ